MADFNWLFASYSKSQLEKFQDAASEELWAGACFEVMVNIVTYTVCATYSRMHILTFVALAFTQHF